MLDGIGGYPLENIKQGRVGAHNDAGQPKAGSLELSGVRHSGGQIVPLIERAYHMQMLPACATRGRLWDHTRLTVQCKLQSTIVVIKQLAIIHTEIKKRLTK